METSFANGGVLHTSEAEPWSRPGMPANIWRWLGKEDAPMLLRYSALPGMWRWGLEFIRNCTLERYRRSTTINLRLSLLHPEVHQGDPRGDRDRLRPHAEGHAQDLHAHGGARAEPDRVRDDAAARHGVRGRRTPSAAWRSSRRSRRSSTRSWAACSFRPTSTATATSSRPACASTARTKLGVRCHFGTEVRALRRTGDRIEAVETSKGPHERRSLCRGDGQLHAPACCGPLGIRLDIYPAKGVTRDRARRAPGRTGRKCRSSTTRGCSA